MPTLALVRHGQSLWNAENRFTGWVDVPLTAKGEEEARKAGERLSDMTFDVAYTSRLTRAQETLRIIMETAGFDLPVIRDEALNERHYGDLQGLNKAETTAKHGADKVKVWRRSYDVPPPAMSRDDQRNVRFDPRYAALPPEVVPDTECLADVVERMLPYWYDAIVGDLAAGHVTLVAAHGNSLRALVKHLDDISDDEISELNIPTGEPLVYELGDDFRPIERKPVVERYLRSPEEIKAAADAVARQAEA